MLKEYHLKELKIEINRKCPLHCLHCSSNGSPNAIEQIKSRRISELIREFADLGGEKLCISGGEPLCHPELSKILGVCQREGFRPVIYTSGIMSNEGSPRPISDAAINSFTSSGVKCIFSLHGASAETHDRVTEVEGSFDATMTAIEKTMDSGLEVEIHVVPMSINFHELNYISELLSEIQVHKVSWLRFVPQGRGFINRSMLQLNQKQLYSLAKKKAELQIAFPSVQIRTGAPFNILCHQFPIECDAGDSVMTIRPDGNIAPCDAFKRFSVNDEFGNILDYTLSEVWHKSSFLNAIRSLHEHNFNSTCTSCSQYLRCNSGCIAQKAIAASKITDGIDPDCLLLDREVIRDADKAFAVR